MNARDLFSVDGFGDLLAFPFQRGDWQRRFARLALLQAGLFVLVPPLAEMIEMGLAFAVLRRIAAGEQPALPGCLDRRQVLLDGLRWWLVALLFNLPALAVLLLGLAAGVGLSNLPAGLRLDNLGDLMRQGVFWSGFLSGLMLAVLVGWVTNFCMYVAVAHAAHRGTFRAALRAGEWGRVLWAGRVDFARGWLSLMVMNLALFVMQQAVSIPAALFIIAPALIAAFLSQYRRLIQSAAVAVLYRSQV